MRSLHHTVLAAVLAAGGLLAFRHLPEGEEIQFTVPPGFEVEEVYAAERAGTVIAITFDSQGRLVLARERGPIVVLVPAAEGGALEERIFTDQVTNSQGLVFDGPDLLVVGEGPRGTGLYRVVDENGNGRGNRIELIERAVGSMQEHGPHAVFFGPDGYLYWTHGNGTGLFSRFAPLSPLRDYRDASLLGRVDPRGHAVEWRAPGGTFLRKRVGPPTAADRLTAARYGSDTGGEWELVAAGFRNQYDGAFNLIGELFTFDSDMEWDRDLPWYKGIASVHVVPGGDYAWRSGSMNHPVHYFDDLPPMADLGRGSPTGVVFYHSYNYPAEYFDAFLQADWSRGRIVAGRLTRNGATYTQEVSNFVYGEPLNVTDVEVGPDGNVYFVLGGRNTRGGVYRVVYTGPDRMQQPAASTPLDRLLSLPQPRSAWSREQVREIRRQMGESTWRRSLTRETRDPQASPERRIRAIELLQVFGPGLPEAELVRLASDPAWEVRAAAVYQLGTLGGPTIQRPLADRLADPEAFVQRRAAEALIRSGVHPTAQPPFSPADEVLPLLASPDRFVRYAARSVLRATNPNLWQEAAFRLEGYPQAPEALMAIVQSHHSPRIPDVTRVLGRALDLIEQQPSEPELLSVVRVVQRALIDAHQVTYHNVTNLRLEASAGSAGTDAPAEGRNNVHDAIGTALLARFPAADSSLSRELARTLVYTKTPGAVDRIATELDRADLARTQRIFYADVLSHATTGWDSASIATMTGFLETVYHEDWRGGASFDGFIDYIRDDFLRHVPPPHYALAEERLTAAAHARVGGFTAATTAWVISPDELFEELIYNPDVLQGSAEGGVVGYEKGGCIACHTFGPIGREFGPDLSTIHQRFSRRDLVRAVTHPSETVSDLWQIEEITLADGRAVAGTIYREDGTSVVVQIPGTGLRETIPRSQIASRVRSETSAMPEGLLTLMSSRERRNLFLLLQAGPEAIPDSALARLGASR